MFTTILTIATVAVLVASVGEIARCATVIIRDVLKNRK